MNTFGNIAYGLVGMLILLAIAMAFSENRRNINYRTIIGGIVSQFIIASILLIDISVFYPFKWTLNFISQIFVDIINYTYVGATFIFGSLADLDKMGQIFGPDSSFIFAFRALTVIIFFGAFMAVLYYAKVMQFIIELMAKVMVKVMRVSGGEAIAVAANVFVGQTEAPLVIKPYIDKMTKSEIATLMTGGMATIAGGVMATYISILGGADEARQVEFATRFLTASFMAAPAAIVMAKIFRPETEESVTYGKVKMEVEQSASNVIEAAANGASDGMKLALNVAAMLLAFIALIALLNGMLSELLTGWLGLTIDGKAIDFTLLTGYLFSIFGLVIGVPTQDAIAFGSMLGEKMILNEFVAYLSLGSQQAALTERTVFLATFAFCGFANFSSIAIQIGGIGSIAPGRKSDIAKFGVRAVIGGTLATLMTASIAGMFFSA